MGQFVISDGGTDLDTLAVLSTLAAKMGGNYSVGFVDDISKIVLGWGFGDAGLCGRLGRDAGGCDVYSGNINSSLMRGGLELTSGTLIGLLPLQIKWGIFGNMLTLASSTSKHQF